MCSSHTSQTRSTLCSDTGIIQGKECYSTLHQLPVQERVAHLSCYKKYPLCYLWGNQKDWHCPVCLQTPTFPVGTTCRHVFCASCLIAYWKHGSWLDAISCPLCRQKVSVLHCLFVESGADCQDEGVLEAVKDYNRRFSGKPRQVTDYLYDTPLFLHLLLRWLGNMGGLVALFFVRVTVCCFGAVFSMALPPQAPPEPCCGFLGLVDDLLVVFLLLTCVINIRQQTQPRQASITQTATQGILTDVL